MTEPTPLASIEVRWFFPGPVAEQPALRAWFESTAFSGAVAARPAWQGRLDDEPDRYLVLPGAGDMGIKWREGEFQVKGRTADLGVQQLHAGHAGRIEQWLKWSYADVPAVYRELFSPAADLVTVAVGKTRAMRKFRLDTFGGNLEEVAVAEFVDRGLGVELTEVGVGDARWCSLGFEAFPDDSAMPQHFIAAVNAILATLAEPTLEVGQSLSYPAWLQGFTGRGGE